MSSPWFKFYPSDWRADPALRMCSMAARGLWMEMLCLMHEAEPRGSLLVNGRTVTDRQLAALSGVSLREIAGLLSELEEAGVFSREEDATIFSRRMRRDDEKAARDKANGRSGGNPTLKRGVNPPDKPNGGTGIKPRSQKPDARTQKPELEGAAPPSASGAGGAALSLEGLLREAAGLTGSDARALGNTAPIQALINEGVSLDGVILPALRSVAAEGRIGKSWAYYLGAIQDRRSGGAAAPASVVVPDIWVRQDSPEGEAWEAHERASGRMVRWLPSDRRGVGRSMPSRWPPGHDSHRDAA